MKKQIKQIFHNMIAKERTSGRQRLRENGNGTDQEREIAARGESIDLTAQDVFDKVTDQKNFEKIVNDMLHEGRTPGCMLIGNLDRFKDIDEIYGHDAGNAILRSAVNILNAHFEQCTCIGRPVGDTFTLWIPEMNQENADYIRMQVGRVNDRLLHPDKDLPPVSVSVGVAFYETGDDCRSLGKRASKMLYRVKESGRCGCEISMV